MGNNTGTYTVRAKARCATHTSVESSWSPGLSITISAPPEALPPPTLLSPGTGTEPGQEIATTTPTFQWSSVSGAARYGLYISQYPYGEAYQAYQNENLAGTSFTLPSGTLQNGVKYRWKMASFDSKGQIGSLSQPLYFWVNIVQASVFFIEPNGLCSGNSPCYSSIQEGINAAGDGATIKVAQGTYHKNILVDTSKEFTLQGGWNSTFISRAKDPSLTIIDGDITGDGMGDGSVITIFAGSGVDVSVTMEGFNIRKGNSDYGGGIYAHAYSSGSIDITLNRNLISKNNGAMYGGGIAVFSENAGSIATATLTNNIIEGNNAGDNGGGIYAGSQDSSSTALTFINNTVADNTAINSGGGLRAYSYLGTTNIILKNNIIYGNTASNGGDIAIRQPGGITAVNSSYNNMVSIFNDPTYPGTYNDLGGNINANPLFVSPSLGDYHLTSGSPCIDAGINEGAPSTDFEGDTRPFDGNGDELAITDIGADEFTSGAIYPSEGTMGSELTITGSNFGTKKGKVLIGGIPLKVLDWSNEFTHAVLTKPVSPGVYDVTIQPSGPKGTPPIIVKNGFSVKAPEIYSIDQTEGSAYDQVTIHGKFFGTKKGTVFLEYEGGGSLIRKGCKVLSWAMDPTTGESEIVFVVPAMLPKVCDVVVDPYGAIPQSEEEDGFTVNAPGIISVNPNHGSAGDEITVHGQFFGTKKGKVYLGYEVNGKPGKKICTIVKWTVDPATEEGDIVFVVPKGLSAGNYDLIVSNDVGSDTTKFIID